MCMFTCQCFRENWPSVYICLDLLLVFFPPFLLSVSFSSFSISSSFISYHSHFIFFSPFLLLCSSSLVYPHIFSSFAYEWMKRQTFLINFLALEIIVLYFHTSLFCSITLLLLSSNFIFGICSLFPDPAFFSIPILSLCPKQWVWFDLWLMVIPLPERWQVG